MFTVIICSIIALFLTYIESRGQMKNGMKFGFMLLTFLGAIHYNYGNDYMPYLETAVQYTNHDFNLSEILSGDVFHDVGWVLLCWLFKPFGGFFVMVAVLNVIQNIIIYRFIKDNVELKWWPLAVFVYLFTTNFYLMSFSMMRQMFVMVMFLWLWKYIIRKRWWIPLIVLYLCSFIHGSAKVLMPFAFWGFIPMKNAKYVGIGYGALLIVLWLFKNTLIEIFQYTIAMNAVFSEYTETYGDIADTSGFGVGFIINMIPFVLSLNLLMSDNGKYSSHVKSLVALSAISFLIAPFGQIVSLIGRVGMYFNVFSIAAIPYIYSNIKNNIHQFVFLLLYVLITLYGYVLFFLDSPYSEYYSTFHTIFSQIF